MPDLLVKLYALPDVPTPAGDGPSGQDLCVRRAMAYEGQQVARWVDGHFGEPWASECTVAFAHQPIACFIAATAGALIGFACHECTGRGFFGPIGVVESHRHLGIGRRLLLGALHDMAARGYAYAVIGGVNAQGAAFYEEAVGALVIEGSEQGIYPRHRLFAKPGR